MNRIQQSVSVAAPLERVWDALVDFEARPSWSSRVKKVQILGGGPLQEGSHIEIQVDRNRFTPTVIEMRQGERLALQVRGPGFRAIHVYEVRPAGNQTTLLLGAQYGGIVGGLMGRLMRGSVSKDLADELAAIKSAAEAGQRNTILPP